MPAVNHASPWSYHHYFYDRRQNNHEIEAKIRVKHDVNGNDRSLEEKYKKYDKLPLKNNIRHAGRIDKAIKKRNTLKHNELKNQNLTNRNLEPKLENKDFIQNIEGTNHLKCRKSETVVNKNNRKLYKNNFDKITITKKLVNKNKWRINTGILATLILINLSGKCGAAEAPSSSILASFFGYPSTCSISGQVVSCTLSLACWLRGGTGVKGCGGWLFVCCHHGDDDMDNSIVTSDWRYKVSPPKLRQVPQRSVVPTNVFRRRIDDDVTRIECGLPASRMLQKRIIGGREARFAEFPWQAHVRISEFQCGGVLVSRWYVATAAHCVSRAAVRDIVVWLGATDTSAGHHTARKLGVVQKILHPLFQFRMTQPDRYDIALLKLSRPITFMSHILPICLPDYDMDLRGRSGVIAGWGKTDTSNGHTGTNLLRSATVPILSKEQCINWHQSKQILVEIHSEMICAGHSDGHQDACLGDSGGPLIVLDNGRYFLVGITSAGFGCGVDHQPGIYHNVRVTANWIKGVISPHINYIDV